MLGANRPSVDSSMLATAAFKGGLQGELRLSRFTVIKQLGRGSFGIANLVQDNESGQQFVIKSVDLSGMRERDRRAAVSEARVLSKLSHPNIVAYYGAWLEKPASANPGMSMWAGGECLHILLEYCDGGDLSRAIKKRKDGKKYFSERRVITWFCQLASALTYVHAQRILHRDLKTGNIFLHGRGRNTVIKLGDFGVAKSFTGEKSMAQTAIGTPYYMSPEVVNSEKYSYRSDVWALGCVLYEVCSLSHAFEAANMYGLVRAILAGNYPPLPPQYSGELKELVDGMLQRDAKVRPSMASIISRPIVQRGLALATAIESEAGARAFRAATSVLNRKGSMLVMNTEHQHSAVTASTSSGSDPAGIILSASSGVDEGAELPDESTDDDEDYGDVDSRSEEEEGEEEGDGEEEGEEGDDGNDLGEEDDDDRPIGERTALEFGDGDDSFLMGMPVSQEGSRASQASSCGPPTPAGARGHVVGASPTAPPPPPPAWAKPVRALECPSQQVPPPMPPTPPSAAKAGASPPAQGRLPIGRGSASASRAPPLPMSPPPLPPSAGVAAPVQITVPAVLQPVLAARQAAAAAAAAAPAAAPASTVRTTMSAVLPAPVPPASSPVQVGKASASGSTVAAVSASMRSFMGFGAGSGGSSSPGTGAGSPSGPLLAVFGHKASLDTRPEGKAQSGLAGTPKGEGVALGRPPVGPPKAAAIARSPAYMGHRASPSASGPGSPGAGAAKAKAAAALPGGLGGVGKRRLVGLGAGGSGAAVHSPVSKAGKGDGSKGRNKPTGAGVAARRRKPTGAKAGEAAAPNVSRMLAEVNRLQAGIAHAAQAEQVGADSQVEGEEGEGLSPEAVLEGTGDPVHASVHESQASADLGSGSEGGASRAESEGHSSFRPGTAIPPRLGMGAPRSTMASLLARPTAGGPMLPIANKRDSWGRAQSKLASAAVHLEIVRGMQNLVQLAAQAEQAEAAGLGSTEHSDVSDCFSHDTSLVTPPRSSPGGGGGHMSSPSPGFHAAPRSVAPAVVIPDIALLAPRLAPESTSSDSRAADSRTSITSNEVARNKLVDRINKTRTALIERMGVDKFAAAYELVQTARANAAGDQDKMDDELDKIAKRFGGASAIKLAALLENEEDLAEVDVELRAAGLY